MADKVRITGGGFQDSEGDVLAKGSLTLELSQDAQIPGVGQLCSGIKVTIPLDESGNVDGEVYVWPNDVLNPTTTNYIAKAFTSQGQLAWGPFYGKIPSTDPFNLDSWLPSTGAEVSGTGFISVELQTNGTESDSQTKLNLIGSGGVTITDNGGGDIEISSPAVLQQGADIAGYIPGKVITNQNILHYEVRRKCFLPDSCAGSKAKALVAATAETIINVLQNGTLMTTITFAAGSRDGTFYPMGNRLLSVDDYLDFIVVSGDTTLSGIAFTIITIRSA